MGTIIIFLIELIFPLLMGAIFALPSDVSKCERDGRLYYIAKGYASGQILLFALFQPIALFAVFKEMEFPIILKMYIPAAAFLIILFWALIFAKKKAELFSVLKCKSLKPGLLGVLSLICLIFMIVMSFFMTYTDGDDSFYVTVASDAASSDSLYFKNPYTGFATTILFRYALAPFPLWITFISRLSGINTAAVAHTFFPWSMILLSMSVMYLFACRILEDAKKRGIFMLFASILTMFGDYSIYSASNFLLARSRQGKAALASFVIPFLMFLLYTAFMEMEEKGKLSGRLLFFIFLTGFASALCSTMGGAMVLSLTLACAFVMSLTYRKIKYPALLALSAMPSLIFVAIYLIIK